MPIPRMSAGIRAVYLLFPLAVFPMSASAEEGAPAVSPECHKILHEDSADTEAKQRCLQEYRERTSTYQVVVTAGRVEEALSTVPASVSVVSSLEIERSHAPSIADALRDVPGVDVSDAGEPGLKRIRIRGEDSKRVSVLIDGQEFFDPRDVGTPLLIAPEMVERIEVLRGPASVIYGSRAFGGVVNIITKKGGYHPVQASANVLFDSATSGFQESASLFGEAGGIEYRVAAAGADVGNRHSGEGEIDPSEYRNKSSLVYLGRQVDKHHFAFNYQVFDGKSDVYVEPEVRTRPPFLDFSLEAPQRDREKYALFYDYEDKGALLRTAHIDLFRQISVRELNTFSTTLVDPTVPLSADTAVLGFSNTHGLGGNAYIDLAPTETVSVLLGAQASSDDLRQTRDRTVTMMGVAGPAESVVDEATLDSMAGYSRIQWTASEEWELSLGGRTIWTESELDETNRAGLAPDSSDDTAFVGSAALLFSGIDNTVLWAKAGQGYQYPSLSQSAIGAFAGPSFVNPNYSLDPETSWEYELGGRYEDQQFSGSFAFFFADADDYIDHVLCSAANAACIQPAGPRDRVYVNIDSARTWGFEGELRYQWSEWTPYLSGTWIRRQYEREEYSTFDTGLAPVSARLGVQYETELSAALGGWADIYLRAESQADEFDGTSTSRNPGWATLNAAFGVEQGPKHNYRMSVEFMNIFDKFYRAATENIPAPGSAILVRVSAQF
ncbi:MAG: TonB-dependent receptor [Bdellovibrionota bacterium]|nr:MAG: TonB-dependent receptor [Bdellovibrionota bacterium]